MKLKISAGQFVEIDESDFLLLDQWSWSFTNCGRKNYAVRNQKIDGKNRRIYMHRFLTSPGPDDIVDHANGDGLDNRRSNLRVTNRSMNAANTGKFGVDKTSDFKGVHWAKEIKRWRARIHMNGKTVSLGCFESESDAANAYNQAAIDHFGEFANA